MDEMMGEVMNIREEIVGMHFFLRKPLGNFNLNRALCITVISELPL
jgi:hypothetical protein